MTLKKILVVFGTRPEAIKLISIIQKFKEHGENIEVRVCVTGQHRHMLDQVLELFSVKPDYDFDIMTSSQDLTDITSKILIAMRQVLLNWLPDWIVVQGDTTTTLAASLAGFYHKINIAYIESGLRTGSIHAPWPEEMNRRLVSQLALLHFAPTEKAVENLKHENIDTNNIFITGNTGIDTLLHVMKKIQTNSELQKRLASKFAFIQDDKKLLLVTMHRRENFGYSVKQIQLALDQLSERNDIQIVFPVHLNPNINKIIHETLGSKNNIYLLDSQDYLSFFYLMYKSYLIITDSGGIQEEAPYLKKPVLVFRNVTEREEAISLGVSKLIGTSAEDLIYAVVQLLDNQAYYSSMQKNCSLFGDGNAASKCVEKILAYE